MILGEAVIFRIYKAFMASMGVSILVCLTLFPGVTLPTHAASGDLSVRRVSTDRWGFLPQEGESVVIRYQLSQEAKATVKVFDSRDLLIRNLVKGKKQSPGDHAATWDGKDEGGKLVPPGLYSFTVLARNDAGEEALFDLTDLTGGQEQGAKAVSYDADKRTVSYVLPKPGLVNIRYGLKDGGPILGTLLDWVPRPSGLNSEPWDGFDSGHVVYLAKNPKLEIQVSAYTINDNSIVVEDKARSPRPHFVQEMPWERQIRNKVRSPKRRMYDHWQHSRDKCRDPLMVLSFPGVPLGDKGVPMVSKTTPIRVNVAAQDRKWMIGERFEIVIYVDMLFVYEEELGYTPFTWVWNPAGFNPGAHYVTVMLRGYEGHFGTATKKVIVK